MPELGFWNSTLAGENNLKITISSEDYLQWVRFPFLRSRPKISSVGYPVVAASPYLSSSSNGRLRYVIHIGRLCVIDNFVTNQRTKTMYLFIVIPKLVIHSMRHPTVVSGARLCIEFRNWLSLDGCSKTICTDSVKYLALCAADLPNEDLLTTRICFTILIEIAIENKVLFRETAIGLFPDSNSNSNSDVIFQECCQI